MKNYTTIDLNSGGVIRGREAVIDALTGYLLTNTGGILFNPLLGSNLDKSILSIIDKDNENELIRQLLDYSQIWIANENIAISEITITTNDANNCYYISFLLSIGNQTTQETITLQGNQQ